MRKQSNSEITLSTQLKTALSLYIYIPNLHPHRTIYFEDTYISKHKYDWPHHSRNAMSCSLCFLGFGINFGEDCWNKANKKTNKHD